MIQQHRGQEQTSFDLRGLVLVALCCSWLLGIVLTSVVSLPAFIPLMGMVGALIALSILWHDKRARLVTFLCCWLLLGMWRAIVAAPSNDALNVSRYIGPNVMMLKGEVSDEPRLRGRMRTLSVTATSASSNGGTTWHEAHGQVEVQVLGTLIEDPYGANYGDAVQITGKLQPVPASSPPGTSAFMTFPRLHVSAQGGNPIIAALYHLRVSLASIIAQALPQPQAALLIAILLGLRTAALKPLEQAFNVTGTAHLIVPSGFKVTILAGTVLNASQWLYKTRRAGDKAPPTQRTRSWQGWTTTLLVVVCIAAYTVLSGAGSAALRAGVMGVLLVVAPRMHRTYNVYTALALTALLMSMFDPFVLWDVGFQLSFAGTLGIVLLTPSLQRRLHFLARLPFGEVVAENLAVTLAAQIATLPIFATSFQQLSFVAPFANLLTVPLLAPMLLLGALLCMMGTISSLLAQLCAWIAWPVLWYVAHSIDWCAHLPYASINPGAPNGILIASYYAVVASLTWLLLKRTHDQPLPHQQQRSAQHNTRISLQVAAALLILVATGIATLTTRTGGPFTITFFDLAPAGQPSQGEAIFLRTTEGRTVLIDGGLDTSALSQALDSHLPPWQRSLDILVLTSPRAEHLGGLLDSVDRYHIGMVLDAGMLHPSTTYALWRRRISERHFVYRQLSQGATITVDTQVTLHILSPTMLHQGSNEIRDNGLVMQLVAPGLRMLLLGSAAESTYALNLLTQTGLSTSLQAEVVQIEGTVTTPFPPELDQLLALAHPVWLIVTPAALNAQQRANRTPVSANPLPVQTQQWQVIQTAQSGNVDIDLNNRAWTLSYG